MYYYSYDESVWKIWSDLIEIESFKNSNKHFLFLLGRNNTKMNDGSNNHIRLDGEEFQVNGDIRLLLDYEKPDATTMADACFKGLFKDSQITSVPSLPSQNLSKHCYYQMFQNCKKLMTIPTDLLPAKTLKEGCYFDMFEGCEKLLNSCALPAEYLPNYCYSCMFQDCTEFTTLPSLKHISSVSDYSCVSMFNGCKNIYLTNISAEELSEYEIPVEGRYIKITPVCDYPTTFNSTFKDTNFYFGEKLVRRSSVEYNQVTYPAGTYYYMKKGTYYTSNEVIYPSSEAENN